MHKIICPACGVSFETNYWNKKYCGAEKCEAARRAVKNKAAEKRRRQHPDYKKKVREKYLRRRERELALKKIKYWRSKGKEIDLEVPPPPSFISHSARSSQRLDIEQVRAAFAEAGYSLLTSYQNVAAPVLVRCPEGHEVHMSYFSFSRGHRCRICKRPTQQSEAEQQISDFIFAETGVRAERHVRVDPDSRLELDLFFPQHKVAVEFCGLYWHSESRLLSRVSSRKEARSYHRRKAELCWEKDIHLITVFEDEFLYQRDVVLSRICHSLGHTRERIFARKCDLKHISPQQAREFLNQSHLQRFSPAKIYLGLFHAERLVAVATFGSPSRAHAGKNGTVLELKRYASLPFVSVVGGFSRLLKCGIEFARNRGFKEIVSYADMRYARPSRPVYEVVGFQLVRESRYTPHYVRGRKRFRNQTLAKKGEEKFISLSEWELRQQENFDRIWDCGHRSYVLTL